MTKKVKSNNKLVLGAMAFSVLIPAALFIFVLGPIYSVAGNTAKSQQDIDAVLARTQNANQIIQIIATSIVCVVAIFFVNGLIKYLKVRNKK